MLSRRLLPISTGGAALAPGLAWLPSDDRWALGGAVVDEAVWPPPELLLLLPLLGVEEEAEPGVVAEETPEDADEGLEVVLGSSKPLYTPEAKDRQAHILSTQSYSPYAKPYTRLYSKHNLLSLTMIKLLSLEVGLFYQPK